MPSLLPRFMECMYLQRLVLKILHLYLRDIHVPVFALHSVKSNAERCKKWYAGTDPSQKKQKQEQAMNRGLSAKQKQKKTRLDKIRRETNSSKLPDFPPSPP